MINYDRYEQLRHKSVNSHHIDTLDKSGIHLISVVESHDECETDKIYQEGGRLLYVVINESHRHKVNVEFSAKTDIGIVLLDGLAQSTCTIVASRRLERKSRPRPHTGQFKLSISKEWDGTGQQDETITTTPTVSKLNAKNEIVKSDSWKKMKNTFDIIFEDHVCERPKGNANNGGNEPMVGSNEVITAALGVVFSEFWQFAKDVFGWNKGGEEKPIRISIGNTEVNLSSSDQTLQEMLKREIDEVLVNQVSSKIQSFREACNHLVEFERRLDSQVAGKESPITKGEHSKQKDKVARITKELKDLLEQALGGEIIPL
jgi:hypothetical protein